MLSKMWLISIFYLGFMILLEKFGEGTIDINQRQLQMVADSLTIDECRRLSESLHVADYQLDHTPTGLDEPSGVSCLRLLQHWDKHEGKDKTFIPLATRLSQLGRDDLANKLSRTVYGESVMELRELVHLPPITDETTEEDDTFERLTLKSLQSKVVRRGNVSTLKSAKKIFAITCACVLVIVITFGGILYLKITYPRICGKMKKCFGRITY